MTTAACVLRMRHRAPMKKKRLFLAIALPERVRASLRSVLPGIRQAAAAAADAVRFAPEENWHVTLLFLGYQPDEAILPILEASRALAAATPPPPIAFRELTYGPPERPRMVWIAGDPATSRALGSVRDRLADQLADRGVRCKAEQRPFSTHVTLARFAEPLPKSVPPLREPFSHEFSAPALLLMESKLRRSGPEYVPLATFAFVRDSRYTKS